MKELLKLLGVFLANTGVATFVVARFSQPEQGMTVLLTLCGVCAISLFESRMSKRPIHSRYPKMSEADISRVRAKLIEGRRLALRKSA
jgi:cytochrome c biogenesis factor